ncbi:MotE family protein [Paracoccus albus]|uniref:MotE family protein n=1 Tax=Paracoccus albus TaxID=3017784 RepID=UPI0022F0CC33|nr:hypothetical protein [Paracoccus albus]WBU60210.1 hypothetical protein PAF20_15955 [Paracoccus albus]
MPRLIGAFFALSLLPVAALSLQPSQQADKAENEGDLLAGCGDVPEVVELVSRLTVREDRIAKALAALDRKRAGIEQSRAAITAELRRLKGKQGQATGSRTNKQKAVDDDIHRLVAVYEAMKPKDAAAVIDSLPPEFAAELLMRLSPESGARIIAAIDPQNAAILTAFMGARSAAKK